MTQTLWFQVKWDGSTAKVPLLSDNLQDSQYDFIFAGKDSFIGQYVYLNGTPFSFDEYGHLVEVQETFTPPADTSTVTTISADGFTGTYHEWHSVSVPDNYQIPNQFFKASDQVTAAPPPDPNATADDLALAQTLAGLMGLYQSADPEVKGAIPPGVIGTLGQIEQAAQDSSPTAVDFGAPLVKSAQTVLQDATQAGLATDPSDPRVTQLQTDAQGLLSMWAQDQGVVAASAPKVTEPAGVLPSPSPLISDDPSTFLDTGPTRTITLQVADINTPVTSVTGLENQYGQVLYNDPTTGLPAVMGAEPGPVHDIPITIGTSSGITQMLPLGVVPVPNSGNYPIEGSFDPTDPSTLLTNASPANGIAPITPGAPENLFIPPGATTAEPGFGTFASLGPYGKIFIPGGDTMAARTPVEPDQLGPFTPTGMKTVDALGNLTLAVTSGDQQKVTDAEGKLVGAIVDDGLGKLAGKLGPLLSESLLKGLPATAAADPIIAKAVETGTESAVDKIAGAVGTQVTDEITGQFNIAFPPKPSLLPMPIPSPQPNAPTLAGTDTLKTILDSVTPQQLNKGYSEMLHAMTAPVGAVGTVNDPTQFMKTLGIGLMVDPAQPDVPIIVKLP